MRSLGRYLGPSPGHCHIRKSSWAATGNGDREWSVRSEKCHFVFTVQAFNLYVLHVPLSLFWTLALFMNTLQIYLVNVRPFTAPHFSLPKSLARYF